MKIKITNKSQAALEFLTTYGWAFLVIIIMISTLTYFGILNPKKILPDRCSIGPEFGCLDYQIDQVSPASYQFRIRLKNNVGELITAQSIALINSDSGATYTCTTPPTFPINNWASGSIQDLTWSGCSFTGMSAGGKGKVLITIGYYLTTSGSNYQKQVNGEVLATVI